MRQRKPVTLHAGPREAIESGVATLRQWFDLDGVVLGGGTALEAKWHHRETTDLDLFVPVRTLAQIAKMPMDVVTRQLAEFAADTKMRDGEISLTRTHLRFPVAGQGSTPISLSGTSGFWQDDNDPCFEEQTGIPLAANADILLRKMQGRVVAQGRPVVRDAYDFVVAKALDYDAFRDTYAQLDASDIDAIVAAYSQLIGTSPIVEGRSLANPKYTRILANDVWRMATDTFREPTSALAISDIS